MAELEGSPGELRSNRGCSIGIPAGVAKAFNRGLSHQRLSKTPGQLEASEEIVQRHNAGTIREIVEDPHAIGAI